MTRYRSIVWTWIPLSVLPKLLLISMMIAVLDQVPSIHADDVSYNTALSKLQNLQGRLPNDDDYYGIIEEFQGKLTKMEQANLFGKLLKLQHPAQISCDQLLALYKAKRNAISDFKVCYDVAENIMPNSDRGLPGKFSRSYIFAIAPAKKMYLERHGERWEGDHPRSIISMNNDILKTVSFPTNDTINAEITTGLTREHVRLLYQEKMPLFLANLFDEDNCDYPRFYGRDIIQFLEKKGSCFILQDMVSINNKKCVVAFNEWMRFYLCPDLDFAMVRFEFFLPKNTKTPVSGDISPIAGRFLSYQSDLTDYMDCGNGIWVPATIKDSNYTPNGVRHYHAIIKVTNIDVNKNIPDAFFNDVVPEDAMVVDGTNNLVYRQSDHPSIGALLKSTVKSKVNTTLRWVSVISGLVLITVALLIKYRNHLKNRSTST